jgi:hypothetical protein
MRVHAHGLLVVVVLAAAGLTSAGCDDATTATSPTVTSPVTELFSGQFMPGGTAARSFTAASAGTVSITLAQLGPQPDLTVGLGIGIPQSNGSGCLMTQVTEAGAATSPHLTVPVDAGAYCVRLHDLGTLTSQVAFTVTIVRP